MTPLVLLAMMRPVSARGQGTPPPKPFESARSAARAGSQPDANPSAFPTSKRLDWVPAERFDHIRDIVVRSGTQGATLFNAPDEQTSYLLVRRTSRSQIELHSRWDDVIIVRSGAGSIEVGTSVTRARQASAGELRGGELVGMRRLELRAGDVARIPAGVPHAFVPAGTEPWELLVVKVRRPQKPLKQVAPMRSVSTPERGGAK